MKRILLFVVTALLIAQLAYAGSETKLSALSYTSTGVTFANLTVTPPQLNGTSVLCTNCVDGSVPCASGGTGAQAYRRNGAWLCGNNPGAVSVPFVFNFAGPATLYSTSFPSRIVADATYNFPANYTASGNATTSQCTASAASTGTVVFSIKKNDSTAEGTCTFTSSATGVFSSNAAFSIVAGDSISIVPATDATLANVSITLGATR